MFSKDQSSSLFIVDFKEFFLSFKGFFKAQLSFFFNCLKKYFSGFSKNFAGVKCEYLKGFLQSPVLNFFKDFF